MLRILLIVIACFFGFLKPEAKTALTYGVSETTKCEHDSLGNEVWSRVLDMDGNVIEETGNIGMVPFLFQGQYHDRETGLAYNRFRYYDPRTGAYISQDPIKLNGGLRLFGYVKDTNSCIDPLGLKGCYLEEVDDNPSYQYVLRISAVEYPETTQHIQRAKKKGKPNIVTIDRTSAPSNRNNALLGTKPQKGLDRDEWPMAMFEEGGYGADIEYISRGDNRGAGSSISAALSSCPNGAKVKIIVIK